jgi:hypothetical protein
MKGIYAYVPWQISKNLYRISTFIMPPIQQAVVLLFICLSCVVTLATRAYVDLMGEIQFDEYPWFRIVVLSTIFIFVVVCISLIYAVTFVVAYLVQWYFYATTEFPQWTKRLYWQLLRIYTVIFVSLCTELFAKYVVEGEWVRKGMYNLTPRQNGCDNYTYNRETYDWENSLKCNYYSLTLPWFRTVMVNVYGLKDEGFTSLFFKMDRIRNTYTYRSPGAMNLYSLNVYFFNALCMPLVRAVPVNWVRSIIDKVAVPVQVNWGFNLYGFGWAGNIILLCVMYMTNVLGIPTWIMVMSFFGMVEVMLMVYLDMLEEQSEHPLSKMVLYSIFMFTKTYFSYFCCMFKREHRCMWDKVLHAVAFILFFAMISPNMHVGVLVSIFMAEAEFRGPTYNVEGSSIVVKLIMGMHYSIMKVELWAHMNKAAKKTMCRLKNSGKRRLLKEGIQAADDEIERINFKMGQQHSDMSALDDEMKSSFLKKNSIIQDLQKLDTEEDIHIWPLIQENYAHLMGRFKFPKPSNG